MELFYLILFVSLVCGLMVGSFLNVCIYRIPIKGLSINYPSRSFCPKCFTLIKWYDNIPLISFIFLSGKCRYCKGAISLRYPIVELIAGLLFATLFVISFDKYNSDIQNNLLQILIFFVVNAIVCSLLLIATFVDIDYKIIPNEVTYTGILVSALTTFFLPELQWDKIKAGLISNKYISLALVWGLGIIVGGGIIYFLGIIGKIMFRKEAMGFGDVKLLAMIGGFYGWRCSVVVLFLACLFGAVAGIIHWLVSRDRYIPFGPFLSLAAFASIFFRDSLNYYSTHPEQIFKSFLP